MLLQICPYVERPYHPEEANILKRGVSPQFEKDGASDTSAFIIPFLLVPLYGVLGYYIHLFLPLYWAVIIPLILFTFLFFAWHYFNQVLITHRYGHAVVTSIVPKNIQITCSGNNYTVTVTDVNGGPVSWTGPTAILLYKDGETAFRKSLANYAFQEAGETKYRDVPLTFILLDKAPARRWIQFAVEKSTARYWLKEWSLGIICGPNTNWSAAVRQVNCFLFGPKGQ